MLSQGLTFTTVATSVNHALQWILFEYNIYHLPPVLILPSPSFQGIRLFVQGGSIEYDQYCGYDSLKIEWTPTGRNRPCREMVLCGELQYREYTFGPGTVMLSIIDNVVSHMTGSSKKQSPYCFQFSCFVNTYHVRFVFQISLKFTTDAGVTDSGFQITYETAVDARQNINPCEGGVTLQEDSGTINTPRFNEIRQYDNDMTCQWKIIGYPSQVRMSTDYRFNTSACDFCVPDKNNTLTFSFSGGYVNN